MAKDSRPFPEYFRNVPNYKIDVLKNDVTATGVRQSCLFNDLQYFHAVENVFVDMMHDLFEGICKYDICQILLRFITIDKFFSLENFNYRKGMFNYGETEILLGSCWQNQGVVARTICYWNINWMF